MIAAYIFLFLEKVAIFTEFVNKNNISGKILLTRLYIGVIIYSKLIGNVGKEKTVMNSVRILQKKMRCMLTAMDMCMCMVIYCCLKFNMFFSSDSRRSDIDLAWE